MVNVEKYSKESDRSEHNQQPIIAHRGHEQLDSFDEFEFEFRFSSHLCQLWLIRD